MAAPYTLHGIWLSGPTYKAGLMLALSGQTFDYVNINLRAGEHKQPGYLAKSRWGQVPCLTDNKTGKNYVQAAAILGHLAETTGKFAGASPEERQEIREWLLWDYDRLAPNIYRPRGIKAGFLQAHEATLETYMSAGKIALQTLNDHLKGRNWLVGQSASIADIDIYGVVSYATDGGYTLNDYPNVTAWMSRFEALPGFGKPDAILPKENTAAA